MTCGNHSYPPLKIVMAACRLATLTNGDQDCPGDGKAFARLYLFRDAGRFRLEPQKSAVFIILTSQVPSLSRTGLCNPNQPDLRQEGLISGPQ